MEKLENRLIAFLDVLGFSRLLTSIPIEEVYRKYSAYIDEAKTKTFYESTGDKTGRTNFAFARFMSDSLVVVSNDISDVYNVNNFIAAISYLLEIGFTSNLPLRGAIGKGSFINDEERNIYLSERLPELVRLEGSQEWSGCVIVKSAEETVLESLLGVKNRNDFEKLRLRNLPIHLYDIPLKEGEKSLLALNYLFFMTQKQIEDGITYLIEPKKTNMIKYFNFLKSLPVEIQQLPTEFFPAKELKMMKTRSGIRIIFMDDTGNPCTPGVKELHWVAVGRWK